MTTFEKIQWMRDNCHIVYIQFNEHRVCYRTPSEELQADPNNEVSPSMADEMDKQDSMVTVQVYPKNPVSFYLSVGVDIDNVVDAAFQDAQKDLGLYAKDDCPEETGRGKPSLAEPGPSGLFSLDTPVCMLIPGHPIIDE